MNKTKFKKAIGIVGNILLYLFLALCIIAVVLTVFSKRDVDGASEILGYQMRIVTTSSMEKCELTDVSGYKIKSIPIKSMIFVETVPDDEKEAEEWYAELKAGDVLTFRYVYTTQVTITHRITDITKTDGGYIIHLEGDNKNSDSSLLTQVIDTSIPENTNYVIGKVVGQSYPLGLFLSILKTPIGMVLIVIVPCFIIILLEVLKLAGALSAEKKKLEQEEKQKKEDELEELRRKLAALEAQNDGSPNNANATNESEDHSSDTNNIQ